jgi:DNA-binding response OmpR family regulator
VATVLLVEDDPSTRNLYAYALSHEGFAVTMAATGVEALEQAQQATFDVIILDMMMMGGSGLDFLRSYQVQKKAPQTLVIGFSNIDNPGVQDEARKLGVAHYLLKANFDPPDFVAYIKQELNERQGG